MSVLVELVHLEQRGATCFVRPLDDPVEQVRAVTLALPGRLHLDQLQPRVPTAEAEVHGTDRLLGLREHEHLVILEQGLEEATLLLLVPRAVCLLDETPVRTWRQRDLPKLSDLGGRLFEQEFEGGGPVAVGVLVDAPAVLLLQGLDAVRDTPAPLGLVPARLGVLARAAAELQGVYLRELDRAERDGAHRAAGCRSTADLLVDTAGLPVSQARSDTALARRLGLVPGLLDALAGGGLELAAARLVAKAFAALPARLRDTPTAGALISLAGLVDLADLKGKVDELCAALAPDVTDSDLADARETGELTLTDVGAQTRLGGHTDALTGEWLRDVLAAKAEADRGLADPRTSGQRLLDALLDCVRVAIDAGAVPQTDGTPPTLVVVSTETDLHRTVEPGAEQVDAEDALADLFTDLPEDLPADCPTRRSGRRPGRRSA